MDSIANLKEQSDALTPLLLFEAELADGQVERWSSHNVTVSGESYDARVVRHNFFEVQAASESGVDAIPRIALTLGNADSRFSQIDTAIGFRGAKLKARFVFYDLETRALRFAPASCVSLSVNLALASMEVHRVAPIWTDSSVIPRQPRVVQR